MINNFEKDVSPLTIFNPQNPTPMNIYKHKKGNKHQYGKNAINKTPNITPRLNNIFFNPLLNISLGQS